MNHTEGKESETVADNVGGSVLSTGCVRLTEIQEINTKVDCPKRGVVKTRAFIINANRNQ